MTARSTSAGALAAAVLAVVAMLVVPLPPFVLDVLLALDVFFAAAVLIVSLSIGDPLEFSAFPPLLLVATLFRLSLDVSASRLILTQGDVPGGAGTVIPAFGEFVMRGNVVVGLLLFVILIVVQLVVVTSGAQRVAEVAARFTLDAMPGKQMAIDADLHSGLIDADQARARRRIVQCEADFYGAMDGAGKFVRGDAIAAIIIVAINVTAGMGIGVLNKHLDVSSAASTFALLSIGNALATTLPAFLLSTAMGVMVTRAASDVGLGDDLLRQLTAQPQAMRMVGVAMLGLALLPGLPHIAFAVLGGAGIGGGQLAARAESRRVRERAAAEARRRQALERKPESAVSLVGVDQLSIDVGEALLPLLDEPGGSALLSRIAGLRRALALELGFVLPGVRIRDDLRLPPRAFVIRLRDRLVAQAQLHADRPLLLGPPALLSRLAGEAAIDPVSGDGGNWLSEQGEVAPAQLAGGGLLIDPIAVLTSKLAAVARRHAALLIGRQEVQTLLDHVRRTHPAAVKGVVPELASLGLVQRVLQHLLREGLSVRDIVAILETIADEIEWSKDADIIGEAARRRLAPAICSVLASDGNAIAAVTLAQDLEAALASCLGAGERGSGLGLDAALAEKLVNELQQICAAFGGRLVIVCTQALRLPLARFLEACDLGASVLGLAEVAPGFHVDVRKVVELPA
jgi:flagellar biosynthesis protein FlhA